MAIQYTGYAARRATGGFSLPLPSVAQRPAWPGYGFVVLYFNVKMTLFTG